MIGMDLFWDMLAGVWLGFSCVVLKNQRPWCGAWRRGMAGLWHRISIMSCGLDCMGWLRLDRVLLVGSLE